ncbi:MAG: HD domain-containing protein [Lachnospiraceae bacterium]|nr:HD domain-containing protein [Lachnospiraceae bacterium]
MIHPQALLTSLVSVFVVIGAYLNMENPLFQKLSAHNKEMAVGFTTLVENRDGNTGGHIRRTTTLAKELKNRGLYKDELTEDYIKNLVMAAPMHDVGKIAIPDAILQKPGKLTAEEFDVMKTHAAKGWRNY